VSTTAAAARLAPAPTHFPRPPQLAALDLLELLEGVALRLRDTVPDQSRSDRQFISDFLRARYPLPALVRLGVLARRSTSDADAELLAEEIRRFVAMGRAPALVSVDEILEAEQESNVVGDRGEWRFMRRRCARSREEAIAGLRLQLVATRRGLDALYAAEVS
jgi:hypothetical protein